MEPLLIQGKEDTPTVNFNIGENVFEISGRSLPEDAVSFYAPILDWLEGIKNHSISTLIMDMKLEYFNTASSKLILDLLMKLEDIKSEGKNVELNWHYLESDEDMQEAGEEYAELLDVKFNFITM